MDRQQNEDTSVFALSRFQEYVADFRQTLEHLAEIEQTMANAVAEMKAQGQPRERLLVAEMILDDLRGILRRSLLHAKPQRAFSPTSEADVNVVCANRQALIRSCECRLALTVGHPVHAVFAVRAHNRLPLPAVRRSCQSARHWPRQCALARDSGTARLCCPPPHRKGLLPLQASACAIWLLNPARGRSRRPELRTLAGAPVCAMPTDTHP